VSVPELRVLTGARGLAGWLVVLYHIRASIPGLPAAAQALLARGYLAVDFFFLLSGFVIWLSWQDRLRTPGAIATFLRKRIARIWPLHLVMLAFAAALALTLRATGRDDPAFPLTELPLHLLLVQNWGFTRELAWNDPAWSISAEAAAYLAFPALMLAADWRRWSSGALVVTAVAMLTALHLLMQHEPGLGSDIPRYGLLRCLAEFTVGGMLAALWLRAPRAVACPVLVALALAGALLLRAPETLVVPAALAALLLALAGSAGLRRHPLESRIVHRLGEISYATYLSHFLLWKAYKLAVVSGDLTPIHIAVYLALVLVASLVLYHRVELPAQRWLNGLSLRRQQPALR
jgi:peptidoglycan/LPS O-acetylase OafA/YrhL